MPDLTLRQRELVGREIATAYKAYRQEFGAEPSADERRQIVAIGYTKARNIDPGIPMARANPLTPMNALQIASGVAGLVSAFKPKNNPGANPLKQFAAFRVKQPDGSLRWRTVDVTYGRGRTQDIVNSPGYAGPLYGYVTMRAGEALEKAKRDYAEDLKRESGARENPLLMTVMGANPGRRHRARVGKGMMSGAMTVGKSMLTGIGTTVGALSVAPLVKKLVGANPRRTREQLAEAAIDESIGQAWPRLASGVQIPMMEIPTIFREVKAAMATGVSLDAAVLASAAKHRVNRNRSRGRWNPAERKYEIFFRTGNDGWNDGPFPSKEAATKYALRYVAGWRGSVPISYRVLPHGSAYPYKNSPSLVGANPGVTIGDRVKLSAKWLRSTGQYTGEVPFARGEVVGQQRLGRSPAILTVKWDGGGQSRVSSGNLVREDAVEYFENKSKVKANPFVLLDSADDRILRVFKGSMTDKTPWVWAADYARKIGRNVHVVAHPYVPPGFKKGAQVSKMFYMGGPFMSVTPAGQTVRGNPILRHESRQIKTYAESLARNSRMSRTRRIAGLRGLKGAVSMTDPNYETRQLIDIANDLELEVQGKARSNPHLNPAGWAFQLWQRKYQQARPGTDPQAVVDAVARERGLSPQEHQEISGMVRRFYGKAFPNPLTPREVTHAFMVANSARTGARITETLGYHDEAVFGSGRAMGWAEAADRFSNLGSRRRASKMYSRFQAVPHLNPSSAVANPGSRAAYVRERQKAPSAFDPRSLRTVTTKDGHRVVIGCPKGHYSKATGRCKVGTRAQSVLHPMKNPLDWKTSMELLRDAESDIGVAEGNFESGEIANANYRLGAAKRTMSVVRDNADRANMTAEQEGAFGKLELRVSELEQAAFKKIRAKKNPSKFTIGRGPTERSVSHATARRISTNPGGKKHRTITLAQFWQEAQRRGDKALMGEIRKKFGEYQKWTHGTRAQKVKLDWVDHPTMQGTMVLAGAGKQPEALYDMPKDSKRKGLWKHPWDTQPDIMHDAARGLVITRLRGKSKITDFYHK